MRRWWPLLAAGLVVAFAAVAILLVRPHGTGTIPDHPPATATVARGTLVASVIYPGGLAYGPEEGATSRLDGTVTWLAPIGSTVDRGKPLFRIDDTPVVLMIGAVPAYRAMAAGTTGDDVRQLESNLAKLGYKGFTADDTYTDQTATVVKAWQRDLGLPPTGTVELGRVFFAAGPVRIAQHKLHAADVASGQVLTYTGTRRLVTANVPAHAQALAKPGTTATVLLPSGKETGGRVRSVGPPPPDQAAAGGEPTVAVVVELSDQSAVDGLDDGPARVRFVGEERKDVLYVPVGALLALAEGGYGLQIIDGDASRIVAAATGLFADGKVEVSGPGIEAGLTVGMAR
ncbi:peptidoglycan-binding domain-containing protein [Dactylosporangium sp. NPDC049525]|uniref:peptidoglycan-binding domain-containing protein n=1 Tax=Dactylosporangium sp. NPDC049525 TaxID=3154730 RepID=UPI00344748F4